MLDETISDSNFDLDGELFNSAYLNLTSKINTLLLHDFQIEIDELTEKVSKKFQEKPNLPGVIVTEKGQLVGMISRAKFTQHMSRPYSLELFLNRPIKSLYDLLKTDILLISGNTSVVKGMQKLLERPLELMQEPIVVEVTPQVYKLLDIHQLMIAHSEVHLYATRLIGKLCRQLKLNNEKFKELATVDGLTQLANRRRFDEYLAREWQRAAREQKPISLVLTDIDFFKRYNDTYGHQGGDDCLRSCAAAIKESVKRATDLAARYGGEEFAVILPNTEASDAAYVVEEIRGNIAALKIVHAKSAVSRYVTFSFGIATLIPGRNESFENLIVAADKALYQAKEAGRDRYCIYSSHLDTKPLIKAKNLKAQNRQKQGDSTSISSSGLSSPVSSPISKSNSKASASLLRSNTFSLPSSNKQSNKPAVKKQQYKQKSNSEKQRIASVGSKEENNSYAVDAIRLATLRTNLSR